MRRFLPFALLAVTLSSCSWMGMGGDDTPPPSPISYAGCPQVATIRDLTIYQNPPVADDNALVVNARMGNVKSTCGSTADGFTVNASFDVVALHGTNAVNKTLSLPFFVSVVNDQDQILRRDTYEIPIDFDANSRQVRVNTPFNVDVPAAASGAGRNRVLIGFQLSQPQLDANAAFFGSTTPAGQ